MPSVGRVALFCLLSSAVCCAPDDGRSCFVGADCESGVCLANGQCAMSTTEADAEVPVADASSPSVDAEVAMDGGTTTPDAGHSEDARPNNPDTGSVGCRPNHDGRIEASEIDFAANRTAPFRVATDVMVDTAGVLETDGTRTWDFSGTYPNDVAVQKQTLSVEGEWYQDSFPSATYAARLSEANDTLGVFQVTSDALLLLGVVSPEDGVTRTELVYDPPAKILAIPLVLGESFSSESVVTGLFEGLVTNVTEAYSSTVDSQGVFKTTFGDFPVLRVRTLLTRTVFFTDTTVRQQAFVSECFGVVGSVTSFDNVSEEDFDRARELTRFGQ